MSDEKTDAEIGQEWLPWQAWVERQIMAAHGDRAYTARLSLGALESLERLLRAAREMVELIDDEGEIDAWSGADIVDAVRTALGDPKPKPWEDAPGS